MRSFRWTSLAFAAILTAACGTPTPAPRLYQLRTEPPSGSVPVRPTGQATPAPATQAVWELASDVRVPAYLERETLVVLQGSSQLQLLDGHRWAEPLRDALPRVLRQDLEVLRGSGSVWLAPAPAGMAVGQRLRVEILSLQAVAARGAVVLQARWWFSGPTNNTNASRSSPQAVTAEFQVPVASMNDGDAIAAAHRSALWQLAERIVGTPR